MIKLTDLLEAKHMTPAQKKKRGEIYDALIASGMSSEKAGPIATSKAMGINEKATFTDKYDSEFSNKQKNLPDQLQKAILKKKAIDEEMMGILVKPKDHHHDHEASMAKGELRDMLINGSMLYQLIEEGQNLPGWVSAYITLASDYINSVKGYMVEKEAGENNYE
jgi:uncharacterized protein YdaT